MMRILNPATDDKDLLQSNYDKLLHILGSFAALLWLSKVLSELTVIILVLILCTAKTIWNYAKDKRYSPIGDWLANAIGFTLWYLF